MRFSIARLSVLAVAACAQQPSSDVAQAGSPAEVAAVRAEIETMNAALGRWIAAGHVDSIASAYTADAWTQGPNQPPVATRDSIAAMWAGMSTMGTFRLTPRLEDVVVHGNYATERGTYEMSFERARNAPKEAPPSFTDRGAYVVLWVKEGDRWLLKWDIGSSAVPLPASK